MTDSIKIKIVWFYWRNKATTDKHIRFEQPNRSWKQSRQKRLHGMACCIQWGTQRYVPTLSITPYVLSLHFKIYIHSDVYDSYILKSCITCHYACHCFLYNIPFIMFKAWRHISVDKSIFTVHTNITHNLTFWHRSFTFNSNNSPTWCKNFSVHYSDVCLQLNMLQAFSRPSSGAQWLQWQPMVLP
jgi:hypothetical protein